MLMTLFGPAVSVLIYLQMFNWFSKKTAPLVLGFLYAVKAVGYIVSIWIAWAGLLWQKFAVCAGLFTMTTIADIVWYKYYPMEVGIFVNMSERTLQD